MIITIDGPTASGKSTLAKAIAKKMGIYYLATGMLYRAIAYVLVHYAGYQANQLKDVSLRDLYTFLDPNRFVYNYDAEHGEKIFFDGNDITPFLKDSSIDALSSILSADKSVRGALLKIQRAFGKKLDLIVEGRDVGSVVFPDADFKFFLTASVQVRAKRWQLDQAKKGASFSLHEAIEKISERDERDRRRKIAPLVKPSGAIVIDNSDLDFQATLKRFIHVIGT